MIGTFNKVIYEVFSFGMSFVPAHEMSLHLENIIVRLYGYHKISPFMLTFHNNTNLKFRFFYCFCGYFACLVFDNRPVLGYFFAL